jgi:hypothetical protein
MARSAERVTRSSLRISPAGCPVDEERFASRPCLYGPCALRRRISSQRPVTRPIDPVPYALDPPQDQDFLDLTKLSADTKGWTCKWIGLTLDWREWHHLVLLESYSWLKSALWPFRDAVKSRPGCDGPRNGAGNDPQLPVCMVDEACRLDVMRRC